MMNYEDEGERGIRTHSYDIEGSSNDWYAAIRLKFDLFNSFSMKETLFILTSQLSVIQYAFSSIYCSMNRLLRSIEIRVDS